MHHLGRRTSVALGALLFLSLGPVAAEAKVNPRTPPVQPVFQLIDGPILFASTRDGGDRDVFIAEPDGSNPRNLTTSSAGEDYDPFIREDGDLIFFASTRDGGDADIFVMNANGSNPRNLTPTSGATDEAPTITGHVRRVLYFASNRDGDFDIWRSNIDGSGLENRTNEAPGDPPSQETAPFGNHPAEASPFFLGATDRAGGDQDIFENVPSFLVTSALPTNEREPGGRIEYPASHPNLYGLVFQGDRDGSEDVFFYGVPPPGHQLTNLTPGSPGFDGEPARSPTEAMIGFTSNRDGDRDVWVMGSDGSTPTNVTAGSAGADEDPSWQYRYLCDGRTVTVLGAWAKASKPPAGTPRNDVIYFGYYSSKSWPRGGRGNDVICASFRVPILSGGPGNDRLFGYSADRLSDRLFDRLYGEGGNDRLEGFADHDDLFGGTGKDLLLGGAEKDFLKGGPGRDVLNGGPGRDVCVGGPGKDRFRSCERRKASPRRA